MGASQVNFFYDQLLVKEPGASERTPWHQDQPYWAISGYLYKIIRFAMQPGDCLVFQALIVHGASGNTGPRRALATR